MTPEGKRTEFRPLSDHDGLIGQDKKIMNLRMIIIGQDQKNSTHKAFTNEGLSL